MKIILEKNTNYLWGNKNTLFKITWRDKKLYNQVKGPLNQQKNLSKNCQKKNNTQINCFQKLHLKQCQKLLTTKNTELCLELVKIWVFAKLHATKSFLFVIYFCHGFFFLVYFSIYIFNLVFQSGLPWFQLWLSV